MYSVHELITHTAENYGFENNNALVFLSDFVYFVK